MGNLNTSQFDNLSDIDAAAAPGYIATGFAHLILVVFPSIILGPIVLSILVLHFKKTKDPVSLILLFVAIFCTIAPATYGLLMDISLISNQPTLGRCEIRGQASLFWIFFGFGGFLLLYCTGLLSVVQYVSVRGILNKKKLLKITGIFLLFITFASLTINLLILFADILDASVTRRGSLCRPVSAKGEGIIIILGILFFIIGFIPSIVVTFVFCSLTYRHVKRNTIENGNVVKSVLKIMVIITVSVVVIRLLPIFEFCLRGVGIRLAAVSWTLTYSLELGYPLYLLLIISVHRTVRKAFVDKTKLLLSLVKARPSQVVPSTTA